MNAVLKSFIFASIVTAFPSASNAAFVINVMQSGSNVVAIGGGSLDLSGLRNVGSGTGTPVVAGSPATLAFGAVSNANLNIYEGIVGPSTVGTSANFYTANSGSGNVIGISYNFTAPRILVASSYVSGNDLGLVTNTWNNTTIARLGLSAGTYVYRLGSSSLADTYTVNIGGVLNAVPEPATWAMMLIGFGMVASIARYRRRNVKVTFA